MARYTGKNGALYIASSGTFLQVADLTDWVVETEAQLHDASIKGDVWERQIPSHGRGRMTAKRLVQSTLVLAQNIINAINSGTRLDWAVVAIDTGVNNFSTNANVKIQGTGFVAKGRVEASHRAVVVDDFEMVLDTEPTLV